MIPETKINQKDITIEFLRENPLFYIKKNDLFKNGMVIDASTTAVILAVHNSIKKELRERFNECLKDPVKLMETVELGWKHCSFA